MINKDIYTASLRLIAESTDESDTEDYAERAYYILAAFCCNVFDINNALRRAEGLENAPMPDKVCLKPTDSFPCVTLLSSAAIHYLGAMLTIDSFPEFSDKLYDKYCDIIAKISDSLPSEEPAPPAEETKPEPEKPDEPDEPEEPEEPIVDTMGTLQKITDVYFLD